MLGMFQVDTGHVSIFEQCTFWGSVDSGKLMVHLQSVTSLSDQDPGSAGEAQ